jgi:hypothetical protein
MKNDHAILQAAEAGYRGQPVAAMFSSPLWLGHMAGRALSKYGSAAPVRACSSRGYSVRVQDAGGAELIIKFLGDTLDRTEISTGKAGQ